MNDKAMDAVAAQAWSAQISLMTDQDALSKRKNPVNITNSRPTLRIITRILLRNDCQTTTKTPTRGKSWAISTKMTAKTQALQSKNGNARVTPNFTLDSPSLSGLPGLTVIQPVNEHFREAVDYRTYQLIDRSPSEIDKKVFKSANNIEVQMKSKIFESTDPI